MPSVTESLGSASPLESALKTGVDNVSQNQTITFVKYTQLILPLDGYVFWVRSDLIAPPGNSFDAQGSLHYLTDARQTEDENFALSRVVFTSEVPINDFDQVSPTTMYIGQIDGIRFAFNQRRSFYNQAGLYHYAGDAIYPALASQIIDDVRSFDTRNVIVSNSLPVWLGLNKFMPMYPSFLVPTNIDPPYASVHVVPESTQAIQSAPFIDSTSSHYQLVSEKVRVTIYGARNFDALDFQDYIFQYSLNTDIIGIMNMPVVRDDKRTQSEMQMIAMKKTIEFDISYYQARVNQVARQLILSCIPTLILGV